MELVIKPPELLLGGEQPSVFISIFNLDVLETLSVRHHPTGHLGALVLREGGSEGGKEG